MLAHPTHERLLALGLAGMAKAFEEQRHSPDLGALSFEERVAIMTDREAAERDTRRRTARLKFAALRQDACVEDIDLRTPRGIDRTLLARLVAGDWIDRRQNCLITGPTGVGKTEIAKVLASAFGRRLIRLQCYEGLDIASAVHEWNSAAQMIARLVTDFEPGTSASASSAPRTGSIGSGSGIAARSDGPVLIGGRWPWACSRGR